MKTMGNSIDVLTMMTVLFMLGDVRSQEQEMLPATWQTGHASYFGGLHDNTAASVGSACGYGKTREQGYGDYTAAVSGSLFNKGEGCGTCYEVKCYDEGNQGWLGSNCIGGVSSSVNVTASNLCPLDYPEGWCSDNIYKYDSAHFALSASAFVKIAKQTNHNLVPVQYRRVKCVRERGVLVTITGDDKFTEILITNTGGAGDIKEVRLTCPLFQREGGARGRDGDGDEWVQMRRGVQGGAQRWRVERGLKGQPLTFKISARDGGALTAFVPSVWASGNVFEGPNFF